MSFPSYPKYKLSGVEWLGDVPEHWEVGAVKRFVNFLNTQRISLSGEERAGRSGEFASYGAFGIINWIDEFIFEEDVMLVLCQSLKLGFTDLKLGFTVIPAQAGIQIAALDSCLRGNDVTQKLRFDKALVSEDGANLINRATPIAFVTFGQYWVNNHASILKPPDMKFIFWAERIESIDLLPFVTGSAKPELTAEALNNLMITVPPTEAERATIQQRIIAETAKLDGLTAEAERAIDLLPERRTALISAAFIGKIDVRGVFEPQGTNRLSPTSSMSTARL